MPRDPREFIFITASMPQHHKIEGLSDKAFRLLISTWCYCRLARNDGHIAVDKWRRRGTPSTRKELVEAGLFEDDLTGGVIVHDWDDHQQTIAEIEKSTTDAARAAHVRHHVNARKPNPLCQYCVNDRSGHAPALLLHMQT